MCIRDRFFPFGIILGMRFGLFTPSEGGAVAVLYCFVIGKLVYKRLSFRKHFVPIVLDTIDVYKRQPTSWSRRSLRLTT